MRIKPKISNYVQGVELVTYNPNQKTLRFMGARLHSGGDPLRAAWKKYDEFEDKRKKLEDLRSKETKETEEIEVLKSETTKEKEKELQLKIAIESLKQQYVLETQTKEEVQEAEKLSEDEKWILALGDYFCDEDLLCIVTSMRVGKAFTRESLWDVMQQQASQIQLKKS